MTIVTSGSVPTHPADNLPFRSLAREKELWVLISASILYFISPLALGQTFFYRDLYLIYFAQRQHLVKMISSGELPLWNPYLHGGQPFLADLSTGCLYPTSILYFLFPTVSAFNIEIVFYFVLAVTGAYFLSRTLHLSPVFAVIAAVIFCFCGNTLSRINLLPVFVALSYLPWLILACHLLFIKPTAGRFVFAVVVSALFLLTGAVDTFFIGLVTFTGWFLFYPYESTTTTRRLRLGFFWFALVVGIAAIQLFPTTEVINNSARGEGLNYSIFSQWSVDPRRLPELVFPHFLGKTDTLSPIHYWGRKIETIYPPYILNIYFGLPAVALALFSGLSKQNGQALPLRLRRFLLAIFVLSAIFSLGKFLFFFRDLYDLLPFVRSQRFPVKFLAIGILPVSLLAAFAVQHHFENHESSRTPGKGFLAALWGLAIILFVLWTWFTFSDGFANHFGMLFFHESLKEAERAKLSNAFLHTFVVCLLLVLVYQYRSLVKRGWQRWVVCGIFTLDLLFAGAGVNIYAPRDFFSAEPNIVSLVRSEMKDGKLFRAPIQTRIKLNVPSNDVMWGYRWEFEVLRDYTAFFYELPVIFHTDYGESASLLIRRMTDRVNSIPWERRTGFLSAAGVTVVLTEEHLTVKGMTPLAVIRSKSNLRHFLYRIENTSRRASFVTNPVFVQTREQALKAMEAPVYDPRKFVLIQGSPVPMRRCDSTAISVRETASRFNSASFQVSSSCDGYLVFSNPQFPGWRVYVDGKEVEALPSNYAFSSIFLRAGNYKVERKYVPKAFWNGAVLSLFSCLMLAVMTATKFGRRFAGIL